MAIEAEVWVFLRAVVTKTFFTYLLPFLSEHECYFGCQQWNMAFLPLKLLSAICLKKRKTNHRRGYFLRKKIHFKHLLTSKGPQVSQADFQMPMRVRLGIISNPKNQISRCPFSQGSAPEGFEVRKIRKIRLFTGL